jgi:hypothetical protein
MKEWMQWLAGYPCPQASNLMPVMDSRETMVPISGLISVHGGDD